MTLAAAVTGYQTFAAAGAVTGDIISYSIQDGAAWEIGWGTYNSTGPTLTRNPIHSSNANAAISMTANAEVVATIRPADLIAASMGGGVGGPPMYNGTLSVTASASTLIIAVKTLAGADPSNADPVDFFFPNDTGGYSIVRVNAALSLTVSSGATLGINAGTAFRIWFTAFNDAGVVRIGVICCSTPGVAIQPIYSLGDGTESSTVMSAASDNAGVLYTGVAVTSKPMRIIGYAEWNTSGLAVAGTWTITNMIVVRLFGPGVAAPGDTVQVQQTGDTAATSAVATLTVTTTGLVKSFTRKSVCNVVKIEVSGTIAVNLSADAAYAKIYKAGVQVVNSTTAVAYNDQQTAGNYQENSAHMLAYDFPTAGQANPVTYDVRINTSNASGSGVWNRQLTVTLMALTEIQV